MNDIRRTVPTAPAIERPPSRARVGLARQTIAGSCDGVIWFGNLDWWYHNHGHAAIRMATRIARRVPTVWINSIGMRMPIPGATEVAWSRYRRKLRSVTTGLRRDPASGLWIASPWFVPCYTRGCLELNGIMLAAQIRRMTRQFRMRRPSAAVSLPTFAPAVERLPWAAVAFDRTDDFTTMPGVNPQVIAGMEQRLLRLSDHVAYVNEELFERERPAVPGALLLGHGVDFDVYSAARPLTGPRPEAPSEIDGLPRPIVGFYGGMDDYRMDKDLMVAIARRVAPGTLLLIGPEQMDLSRIMREPNVRRVGQLPPERLPAFASQFDVGVIPFLQNDFNRASNPIKLKEYLALGYPIVATRLPAFERYADVMYLADSQDGFLAALDRALVEDDPLLQQRRRQRVANDSWDATASRFAGLLKVEDARGPGAA